MRLVAGSAAQLKKRWVVRVVSNRTVAVAPPQVLSDKHREETGAAGDAVRRGSRPPPTRARPAPGAGRGAEGGTRIAGNRDLGRGPPRGRVRLAASGLLLLVCAPAQAQP